MNAKKLTGGILMCTGILLVCGALALFLWNQREDVRAGASAERLLPRIAEHIEEEAEKEEEPVYGTEMAEVVIDGYAYIGYLSIPVLGLELPVMSEWDYERLKIAPCRYAGSVKSDNLVLCAHNYAHHFGNIKNLAIGDTVYFTDMDGMLFRYEVVSLDILDPAAVEEMTCDDYALTLFTCTYSGTSRVAVRCRLVEETRQGGIS